MSLFRTLDRTSAVSLVHCPHLRPALASARPAPAPSHVQRSVTTTRGTASPRLTQACLEHASLQHLVRKGSHMQHVSTSSRKDSIAPNSRQTVHKAIGAQASSADGNSQADTDGSAQRVRRRVKNFAEKELKALVDYYDIGLDTRPDVDPDDDGTLVWNVGREHVPWPLRDEADAVLIQRLNSLLCDDESSHDLVFDTYKKLPSPGVVYLETVTIRALLHHLSVLERPTVLAMQRFLSVLDDMKTAHIHIIRSEWTTAIHLAGRAMASVSAENLNNALHIWDDMERRAGIKGSFVTFNVLFHTSVLAGKFSLAETFLKEMQDRKVRPHRHHRVSKIYYYGILQDGNAIRRTYQELVASGDIVDTTVMNAVIAALIRAGEPSAAEHVFERMKRLHATKTVSAPGHRFFTRTWRQRRSLGLFLTHEALYLKGRKEEKKLKELQDYAPIAPDSRTYALIIRHHASTTGNFEQVKKMLQEMRLNSVPLEGTIFIVIFRGFDNFGGKRYSAWTRDKLENIWKQYLTALHKGQERTWLSGLAVAAVLQAFGKVTSPEHTMAAWRELRQLWEPNEEELQTVRKVLSALVPSQTPAFFDENIDCKI